MAFSDSENGNGILLRLHPSKWPRRHFDVGVTSDLIGRVYRHKLGEVKGFTKKYGVDRLVYFELSESIEAAIQREKQIKHWNRARKVGLIEKQNPSWVDLYDQLSRP